MRPSQFEAIRPHLEWAMGEIDADFTRKKQSLEIAKELEEEFDRSAALPKGTPSKTKLKTIPRKKHKQVPITRPLIENAYPWRHSAAKAAI